MTFAEDQDAVGELGSDGQDEAFGDAVRSRTSRWDLHGINAVSGHDSIKRGGELAGAVADEEPKCRGVLVEVHQQVTGLLSGPGPGRVAPRSEYVHVAAANLEGEEHVDPFQGDCAGDVEESRWSLIPLQGSGQCLLLQREVGVQVDLR